MTTLSTSSSKRGNDMPDLPITDFDPKALKTVDVGGRKFFLSRRPPTSEARSFLSRELLKQVALPTPPDSITIPASCALGLSKVMMNDQLGCCVISQHGHYLANITSQAGAPFIYSDAQIIADYSAVGGYVPGNPWTDSGCNVSDDIAYLISTGFADGSKLLGSIDIDPSNKLALQQATFITNELCFGIAMPNAW